MCSVCCIYCAFQLGGIGPFSAMITPFPLFFLSAIHNKYDLLERSMSVSSFEVNAAAAMRDYYVEPRLGRLEDCST